MNVALFALAVVTVAVGSLDDARGATGGLAVAVAVAGGRGLLHEVDGNEGGDEEDHAGSTHLVDFC